ncbi:MAG: DNA topoisomerase IB [Pararhodobacter sp.]
MLDRMSDPGGQIPGLIHVSDSEPGLGRRRAGKGFFYLDHRGKRIGDPALIARIRALAIPPAWSEVWICPEPAGHIQATGRDSRQRKQYRYHPDWDAWQGERKFAGLTAFARALPRLRDQVDRDLRRRGVPRERVIATIVRLLDKALIRIGNDRYALENRSFGLTTLTARHLALDGTSLRFSFIGKSGKEWRLSLTDRRIANAIRSIQDLPGQRMFRYHDDDGQLQDVRSQDVNTYIREAMGPDFTSKHFRTWGASVQAALSLSQLDTPPSRKAQVRLLNAAIDEVARSLRNTRTVCRQCYIHPRILDAWETGVLGDEMTALRRRLPRPLKGLEAGESQVLRWLSQGE